MQLRLGYKASAEQFSPKELLENSVAAEAAGFESVFISDHFQPWRHTGGHAPFAMSWLGALGARTSKIMMGTSVLTPTFRYHPSIVAQSFGTLGSLFPGRLILGSSHRQIVIEQRKPAAAAPLGRTPRAPGMPFAQNESAADRLRRRVFAASRRPAEMLTPRSGGAGRP